MYSIGEIVNGIVKILYGYKWKPELLWWSIKNVYKYGITMIYIWN